MAQPEHEEQVKIIQWVERHKRFCPQLDMLYHVPNGGHRHKAVAAQLQRAGVKPGVPDLAMPVARKGWHGLYIELKYGRNEPTEHQLHWLQRLTEEGYLAVVCYGHREAIEVLKDYLDIVEIIEQIEWAAPVMQRKVKSRKRAA